MKNKDPELFKFYLKNYPEILVYKDKITVPQTKKLPEKILWKRLLNFSWENFHVWNFLCNIAVEFFKIPVLRTYLIMLV